MTWSPHRKKAYIAINKLMLVIVVSSFKKHPYKTIRLNQHNTTDSACSWPSIQGQPSPLTLLNCFTEGKTYMCVVLIATALVVGSGLLMGDFGDQQVADDTTCCLEAVQSSRPAGIPWRLATAFGIDPMRGLRRFPTRWPADHSIPGLFAATARLRAARVIGHEQPTLHPTRQNYELIN